MNAVLNVSDGSISWAEAVTLHLSSFVLMNWPTRFIAQERHVQPSSVGEGGIAAGMSSCSAVFSKPPAAL